MKVPPKIKLKVFVYGTFLKLDDYDLEYEAISIDTQPCAVNAYCLE